MRVLITDAEYKHTLAAVRSLGMRGIEITAVSHLKHNMSFYSKYCNHKILCPNPRDTKAFVTTMLEIVESGDYDVLLPIGYNANVAISRNKKEFESYVKVPIVEYDSMKIACNKDQTMKFAESIGVPIPKTIYPTDLEEVRDLSKKLKFPVVIKDTDSSAAVSYANSFKELIKECKRRCENIPIGDDCRFPIVQEYIPGRGYGFFALFNHSKPRAIFEHMRLREYPITGGPSTMAKSVYNQRLKEIGLNLLTKLRWHGVAMAEFKLDSRDKEFKLLEINPKFWGSLNLAIASGVDFPYLTCKMAIDGDIDPIFEYRENVKFRWLFPWDILHFISNIGEKHTIRNFIREFSDKNICYDISLADIKPNIFQIIYTSAVIPLYIIKGELRFSYGKPIHRRGEQ